MIMLCRMKLSAGKMIILILDCMKSLVLTGGCGMKMEKVCLPV